MSILDKFNTTRVNFVRPPDPIDGVKEFKRFMSVTTLVLAWVTGMLMMVALASAMLFSVYVYIFGE